jgi:ParB family transcriptional regulator, chromosome partitioning protein
MGKRDYATILGADDAETDPQTQQTPAGSGVVPIRAGAPETPPVKPGASWSSVLSRGSNAVGAVGSALENMRGQTSAEIAALKSQLEAGETIVEIETDKILASFVSDRFGDTSQPPTELVEQIKDQGQLIPILVRPHPEKDGHYQIAYGHRRVAAARKLGIKVRAIVRNLSNEELVIAQGQENNARLDLSYIEKALFAVRLEEAGFNRQVIGSSLAVSKTELSGMISVASKIPRDVILAIGAAPGIGRPRWQDLTEIFKQQKCFEKASEIIAKPEFSAKPSDDRFLLLLAKLSKKEKAEISQQQIFWNDTKGRRLARITDTDARYTLQIDKSVDRQFGAFLFSKLDELYRDYEATQQHTN